jgi:malate dehydrogenase (oxaloacetate-decarboxylating)(NADP+)
MAAINPRPIIFPLSNPVSLSECTFETAIEHTDGAVLFASGSPFPSIPHAGRMRHAGQGNNMYVFPGLGLGAILAKASKVTEGMVEEASLSLAGSVNEVEQGEELLYPRVERIREISVEIAMGVVRKAQKDVSHLQ